MATQQIPARDAMADFKERVIDRMKTDIGTLMPDDVLQSLVKQAVQDTFFKQERVPNPQRSYSSSETVLQPSWFQREIVRLLTPMLEKAAQACVEEHREEIKAAVKEALTQEKLLFATAACIGEQVRHGFMNSAQQMIEMLQSKGIIRY